MSANSANIKNENIDITSILKDVETCIKKGLSTKLDTFFGEYDKYKRTHEEVLNLSIVRELLKNGSSASTHNTVEGTKAKAKIEPELELIVLRNQVLFLREEVNKYQTIVNNIKKEPKNENDNDNDNDNDANTNVSGGTDNENENDNEPEFSQINLEIKEKEAVVGADTCSDTTEDTDSESDNDDNDGDDGEQDGSKSEIKTINLHNMIDDTIQNIVLKVTEKDVVADV